MKKYFFYVFICLSLFAPTLRASAQSTQQASIIYEYEVITQKKGSSLKQTLQDAGLSSYQTRLVEAAPIIKTAKSDRVWRFIYAIEEGKRLLREFNIKRGNREAHFVLTGSAGNHRFVSKGSTIPKSQLRKTTAWSGVRFDQDKGQPLESAWKAANLTQLQKQIVLSGDFIKKARGKRQFSLFFEGDDALRLLRGMHVERGNNRVEYTVQKKDGKFQLINLKTLSDAKRKAIQQQFSNVNQVKSRMVVLTSVSEPKITQQPSKSTEVTKPQLTSLMDDDALVSGDTKTMRNYRLIRVTQKKGQSIDAACKKANLSRLQQELVANIPVTKSAKSTRQFNLLFKTSGKNKYLKAVRVTRGKNLAEFVLVKHKGKWTWANQKGQISVTTDSSQSSAGFLRYPVSYSRISSHYNPRRRHPITGRIRPHKGTDFKAPHGAPVWAPANGVVTFAGRQRGYGITLVIDHQNGYKTKYAHLSRITRGLRPGVRVRKKQIIAKVGNTGVSSGSHLHYEVIVNGRHRNPLSVRLPGGGGDHRSNQTETTVLAEAKKAAQVYLPKLRALMS